MVASENHIKSYTSSRFTGGNNRRNQSFSKGHQRLDSQTVIKGRCKSHDKVSMRSMGVPQKMQLPPPEGASSDSKTTITTELSRSGHSELGHMNHDNTPTAVSIYEKVVENSNDDEFIVEYNEKLMTSFCCPGLSHSRNSNSLKEKSILENKNNNNNKDKDEEANNAEDGGFVTKIEEAFMYLIGRAPPVRIIYCSEENSVENSEVSIPKVLTDMEQLYIMEQLQLHEHQQRQDSFEPSEKHNHQLCTQKSFDESTDLSAALSATLSASKSFRSCRLSRTFSKSFTRSTSATAHTSIDEKSKSNTISTELESLRSKDSIMDLSLLDRSNTGIIEIKNLVKSKKKKVVLFRNRSKKGSDKVLSQAGLAEC